MSPETESLPASASASTTRPSFVRRHGRKLAILFFWLSLLGGYQLYAWQQNLTPLETVRSLADFMASSVVGALIFIALYTACPLLFFPVGLLAAAGGFVFGPLKGGILTLLGTAVSSSFAYLVGRYFGKGLLGPEKATGVAGRYADRLRENGFEAVLIARLTFLPFDLINYLAGLVRIGWKPFILASMLGSLPGTLSFALLGASVGMDFSGGSPALDPWLLSASGVLFVGSLVLSRHLKRRERKDIGEAGA